jgi:flagellum-specific ATP synthase
MGAYRSGADPAVDAALAHHPAVTSFIAQEENEVASLADAAAELIGVFGDS